MMGRPWGITILTEVGPGEETGIYYMPVSNLPFKTSWQQLKDYIRSACDVDHTEVFHRSASGWIRFKGKANFEQAWCLIQSRKFKGRELAATDRNRTEPINIKRPIASPRIERLLDVTIGQQVSGSTASPDYAQTYASSTSSPFLAGSSLQGDGGGYQTPITAGTSVQGQPSPLQATGTPAGNSGSSTNGLNPNAPAFFGHGVPQFHSPYGGLPDAAPLGGMSYGYGQPAMYAAGFPPEYPVDYLPGYLPTEQRKLHVSQFPPDSRVDEVTRWIRRQTGPYATYIQRIEVPQRGITGPIRGHAFVIFDAVAAAQEAQCLLNKATYREQRMTAKLTVEGVTMNEPPIPTGPRSFGGGKKGKKSHHSKHKASKGASSSSHHHHQKGSKDKKHDKSRPDEKKDPSAGEATPPSCPEKKPSPDDKSAKDPAAPVVVDGRCRRTV